MLIYVQIISTMIYKKRISGSLWRIQVSRRLLLCILLYLLNFKPCDVLSIFKTNKKEPKSSGAWDPWGSSNCCLQQSWLPRNTPTPLRLLRPLMVINPFKGLFFFFFLVASCSLWDLSFMIQPMPPCIES